MNHIHASAKVLKPWTVSSRQKDYSISQGLIMLTPSPTKSLILRVTRVRPCSKAVAPIIPSAVLSGIPCNCRMPSNSPQRSATGAETGNILPSNQGNNSSMYQPSKNLRRFPSGSSVIPFLISPSVTTLRNRLSSSCASSHCTKRGSGCFLTNSEGILVSSKYSFTIQPGGKLMDCAQNPSQAPSAGQTILPSFSFPLAFPLIAVILLTAVVVGFPSQGLATPLRFQ